MKITVKHVDNNLEKFLKKIVYSSDIDADKNGRKIFKEVFHNIMTN